MAKLNWERPAYDQQAWRDLPATPGQKAYLRQLARSRHVTYQTPHDRGHASDQITILQHANKTDLTRRLCEAHQNTCTHFKV